MVVYKDFQFDSAHKLENKEKPQAWNQTTFGKCYATHGHTYKLRVGVRGVLDEYSGMIINFVELKRIVFESVLSKVDHSYLNDCELFPKDCPVTAEHMVLSFWTILANEFRKIGITLQEICLWETATSFVKMVRE